MNKSGNSHIPVFVTSAGSPHLEHHVVEMVDSGVWSPHGDKVPTLHYSVAQLMSALSKGSLPNVKKNKDGRLEIPIKLDAHISIPEFQQAFGNLFTNYTAGITQKQPHGGKTMELGGYVPPDKNEKDVTGFALLGKVPQSIYHPPSFISEPPTSDYSPPEQKKASVYSNLPPISSLYSLPNDNYEAPASGYAPPEPSYKPPQKEYHAPESSYNLPTKAPTSLYETPSTDYKPPKASYDPPDSLKSLYDTPFKEYKAPKTSYEEPKEYSAPKNEYSPPNKPKLETGYQPPSTLYKLPKEYKPPDPDTLYETPAKEYVRHKVH